MFRRNSVNLAALIALGAAVAPVALLTLPQDARAQSNASGGVAGVVQNAEGATVLIENLDTGLKRTLTPDATGRVSASALPVGRYKASLIRDGKVVQATDPFEVVIGQNYPLAFGARLETVTVTSTRRLIDTTTANIGTNFTAAVLEGLPIGRNLNDIVRLAPGTSDADSRYGNAMSIAGGAPSENAYYINGFPATNPLSQLGSAQLPFGAIEQAQVLTTGYGVEYGRSVGGVLNVVTKSGSNTFEAGGQVLYSPQTGRGKNKDFYYAVTGDPANATTDGKLRLRGSDDTRTSTTTSVYAGGPIIKDKLFFFAAAEQNVIKRGYVSENDPAVSTGSPAATKGWTDRKDTTTRLYGKLNFNITDDHLLEATLIRDKPESVRSQQGYDYTTGARNGQVVGTQKYTNVDGFTDAGADIGILKYVGNLTDNLTLTALYGKSKTKHTEDLGPYSGTVPGVLFGTGGQAPGITYAQLNPVAGQRVLAEGSKDSVKSFRLDLEWRVGAHTIRAGLDNNKLTSINAGEALSGGKGTVISYLKTSATNALNTSFAINNSQTGGQRVWLADPQNGALAAQGYYGREQIFITTTNAYSDQDAMYIEDKWRVTKDLTLTGGIRKEGFENRNGDNVSFLKMDNQINPRLAAAWDVTGDGNNKLSATVGRYSIQIPTHIAVRGASRSTFTRQFFTYTGVDENGQPVGRRNITTPYSANNEYGQAKDAKVVSALDMKPTYQDEISFAFEKALSREYIGRAQVTYRSLKTTIDDNCDFRPFEKWAADNNVDTSNWRGFGCATFNPGRANSFLVDFNDGDPTKAGKNYTRVDLSAEALGFPKAKRTYFALDLSLEHPKRNGWYGKVTYTYSKSKGNTEGQTLSDVGQTDVAATQTWDHPELMEYAYGYLPGDRRHAVKAFGFVEVAPEWEVGANLSLASGRPRSCLGWYAGSSPTIGDVDYGSSYHYCDDKVSPRGALGNLPMTRRLDLSLNYAPKWFDGLRASIEVFNVTNSVVAQNVNEVYMDDARAVKSNIYGQPISYSTPRRIQLAVQYNKQF